MDSTEQRTPNSPSTPPLYATPYLPRDDEIDLIDLWRILVKRKAIVLITTLIGVLSTLAYVLLADPVYRTEVRLLPPLEQHIQGLVIGNAELSKQGLFIRDADIEKYTPEMVYAAFTKNLKSIGLRREFFDKNDLLKHYVPKNVPVSGVNPDRIFEEDFNENLTVEIDKEDGRFVTTSFALDDATLASQWLNAFVDLANRRTVEEFHTNLEIKIGAVRRRLGEKIANKLKLAKQRRDDHITTLEEALRIAQNSDIQDSDVNAAILDASKAGIAVNTAEIPLYMRGIKALKAEIGTLKARENDAPFVAGLRDVQEQLTYLKSINISKDQLAAAIVDQAAIIPDKPERPKSLLILLFGLILSGVLGLFAAFFAEFLYKAKKRLDVSTSTVKSSR